MVCFTISVNVNNNNNNKKKTKMKYIILFDALKMMFKKLTIPKPKNYYITLKVKN